MLKLVQDRAASLSEREWITIGIIVFSGVLVLSLAVHAGYALAWRDLVAIRDRHATSVRDIPIREGAPDDGV